MPQLALYLDEATARLLDEAVRREGTNRSAWVRRAIAGYLAQNKIAVKEKGYDLSIRPADPRWSSEVREPSVPDGGELDSRGALTGASVAEPTLRQARLEALRQGRDLEELIGEALASYLEAQGRPVEEDPVAAGWGP